MLRWLSFRDLKSPKCFTCYHFGTCSRPNAWPAIIWGPEVAQSASLAIVEEPEVARMLGRLSFGDLKSPKCFTGYHLGAWSRPSASMPII